MLFHLNDFLPVWLSSAEHAHMHMHIIFSEEASFNCVFVHTVNVSDFRQGNNMKIIRKKDANRFGSIHILKLEKLEFKLVFV